MTLTLGFTARVAVMPMASSEKTPTGSKSTMIVSGWNERSAALMSCARIDWSPMPEFAQLGVGFSKLRLRY